MAKAAGWSLPVRSGWDGADRNGRWTEPMAAAVLSTKGEQCGDGRLGIGSNVWAVLSPQDAGHFKQTATRRGRVRTDCRHQRGPQHHRQSDPVFQRSTSRYATRNQPKLLCLCRRRATLADQEYQQFLLIGCPGRSVCLCFAAQSQSYFVARVAGRIRDHRRQGNVDQCPVRIGMATNTWLFASRRKICMERNDKHSD